jgi:kinase
MLLKMANKPSLLIFLLSILLASNSDSAVGLDNNGELQALLTIKQDWGNPTALRSWKSHSSNHTASPLSSHCQWVGVACSNGQVTALSFQNSQIANPIPASICSLKNLSYLDLSYNDLTLEFPTTLYSCSVLQYLDLSNNGFSGALPADINNLSSGMEHLNLSSNGFTGSVPSGIAGFSKLKSLVLDTNRFDGSYPAAAISNLIELETLTLASNPFAAGPIPHEFSKLTKLKMLWLSGMNLTGGIPDELSPLDELTLLDLSGNNLHGQIPVWVWKNQKMQYLYLYTNSFTGGIGPNINAISMLQLDLSSNELTEPLPETIGNMKNLTSLYLYFNKITGTIPTSVGLLPNLQDLRIFNNMLSGPLPPKLGKHSPLGNLEVANNNLTGEVPDTLCFNKKLYDIVLFNNNFSGMFPTNLGECNTLNNIMLYNNHFTGEFPGSVWSSFPMLTNVMIQNNDFTGVLPTEVSSNISRIEIGNNRFSGAVPASATGLHVFKAENNWFSHGLPADMRHLANLAELSLAGNQISGSVPSSIVALKRLASLNLSRNQISGAIPAAIGQLPVLTMLDLSNNSLVGDIPVSFNNLHLSILNLSDNQLTGVVPDTLQVTNFNGSFRGNPGLCAGRLDSGLSIPLCHGDDDQGHSSSTRRRRIILLVVLIAGVILVGSVAVIWLVVRSKNKQRDVTSWKMVPFRPLDFTEHDILSKISEENVIGKGGSGKVYRIHLGCCKEEHDGDEAASHSVVALKKIGNAGKTNANLDKEFEAEVTSLGSLRHGNIINLLCCISGDDTKLLVYEYMENGSLDRWLHRRRRHHCADEDGSGPLDWPTRLSIAVDVARGLSYMHHDSTRPVIHRDVKCSNILLDCGFRAKIADFGLARILAKSGESESASAVCGTFGYIAPG